MNSILIFNEHSLPFISQEDADHYVPLFLKLCIKASNLGLSTILMDETSDKNWFRIVLANGYSWQDWHNKHNNDMNRDMILAFRKIQTRQPFFTSEEIGDDLGLMETIFENKHCFNALNAAVWHESPVVSFPVGERWNASPLIVDVDEILENEDLVSYKYEIINLCSLDILEAIESELRRKNAESITRGKEIVESKNHLFSSIIFCGKSKEQLLNWTHSATILQQVKESLSSLNSFSEKWQSGEFAHYSHENLRNEGLVHRVSGESQTVSQNNALRKEREFWLPNGKKEFFENHIKIAKGFRIHFFPLNAEKKICVGYVGPHLRLK